ncbi:MAG: hypothetical protein FWG84_06740 [Bacteroidales bacterium]|nr:hypothetical protein [Bacteroidales bacterium]
MKMIKRASGLFPLKMIAILFVMSSLQMSAKTPSEFSVFGGGGYAAFHCQPSLSGASSGGFAGDIGGAFTGFVSPQVGFHIGAGLGFYNVNVKVNELNTKTVGLIDQVNNNLEFDLYTTLYDYKESHRTFCLSIPIMIHFQSNMDNSWNKRQSSDVGFYLLTGIKANILLSRKYDSEVGSLFNAAYYQAYDNWAATQTFAGLGLFTEGAKASGSLDFGVLALFTLETGAKWRLNNKMFLYTGVYFDYGLIDPSKSSREPVKNYLYQEKPNNSALPSYVKGLDELTLLAYTDKMNLMTIGLKLRLAFTRTSSPFDCPRGF